MKVLFVVVLFLFILDCKKFSLRGIWIRGKPPVLLNVTLDNESGSNPLTYKLLVDNEGWLEGNEVSFFCNGQWHSNVDNSLKLMSVKEYPSKNPELGNSENLELLWISSSDNTLTFSTLFTYFSDEDVCNFFASFRTLFIYLFFFSLALLVLSNLKIIRFAFL